MFLSLLVSCVLQVPDVTPMDAHVKRSSEGFTSVFDVAEMDDGRVLLTDNRDRAIFIVDFSAPSVTPLGREGEGPKEYRSAFSILPQPDGRFFVYDTSLRRFLVLAADGTIEGTQPFCPPPLNSFSAPRGPDGDGYLYMSHREVSPDGLAPDAILYKWHPEMEDLQQIGTFSNYAPGQQGRGFVPMPREDAWTVHPDGRVGKLVAEDYHWEWMDGRVSPPVDFPKIRVGEEEREAWLDEVYSRSAGGSSSFRGGTSSRTNRRPVDPGRFPRFVPPFNGEYLPAAPWGHVWVKVEVLSGPTLTVFDVFDGEGHHLRRVSLDGDARVVGFGSSVVYIARKGEYDLEWLEQYADGG
jgi:hypothetical protein